ncbi:MAG TPA: glycosyltransferase family 87 protein [Chloroflexota bacterium]
MTWRNSLTWLVAAAPLVIAGGVFVHQLGFRDAMLATDFRAYYTAGRMLLGGVRSDFYAPDTQWVWQHAWAPEVTGPADLSPFRNPPFVAAIFAPLALLPAEIAFGVWSSVNVALLITLLVFGQRALAGCSARTRRRAVLLSVSFLPVVVALLLGQLSLLLALALLGAWAAFRSGHDARAGLWLAILLAKPQFLVLPALVLLIHRRWRAIGALVGISVVLGLVSIALLGVDGMSSYVGLTTGTLGWQDSLAISPQRMYTWRGLLQLLWQTDDPAPVQGYWLAGALLATLVTLAAWTRSWKWNPAGAGFDVRWAMVTVAALFTSPYANFHDVSLLVVAGVLTARAAVADWQPGSARRALAALPVVGYLSVLATQLSAPVWHLQLSVMCMLVAIGILGWVALAARLGGPEPSPEAGFGPSQTAAQPALVP